MAALGPAGPPGVLMVSLVPSASAVQASRQPQQILQPQSDGWECVRKLWFPQHLWPWWRGRGRGWGLPRWRRRSRLCVFRHWDWENWVSMETAWAYVSHITADTVTPRRYCQGQPGTQLQDDATLAVMSTLTGHVQPHVAQDSMSAAHTKIINLLKTWHYFVTFVNI